MKSDSTQPLYLAASYTIGTYILPGEAIEYISEQSNNKMRLNINSCDNIVKGVKTGEFDLGFIESPIFDDELTYREWLGDELIVCSKIELPKSLDRELLSNYKLICREENSPTRSIVNNFLEKFDLSFMSFESLLEINNTTAAIQSVKWSKPNLQNPTITFVSNLAIEDELKHQELFQSRIFNHPIKRTFYIITQKDIKEDSLIQTIINGFLEDNKEVS